jgi:predicted nucleic acid-binding protein
MMRLAHTDVCIAVFDRRQVQSDVVKEFTQAVHERAVHIAPWVRTELLARTRDGRNFARLHAALEGFPDLRVGVAMQVRAGALIHQARREGQLVPTVTQALAWALAETMDAMVWTRDRRWLALSSLGCPVSA